MEDRKIYKTLRICYKDDIKLIPSWKIDSIENLKEKVITRFDLLMKKDEFDLEYFDEDLKGVLVLQNLKDTNKIDEQLMSKLINKQIELLVVKKQLKLQKQISNKIEVLEQKEIQKMLRNNLRLEQENQTKKVQKHYAQCDKCLQFPIMDNRYKCIICDDIDLCQKCYTNQQQSKGAKCHPFMKIKKPIDQIEKIKVYFNEQDLSKMAKSCLQTQEEQLIELDFKKLHISQDSLPHKTIVSGNFVQKLFNEKCAKRNFQIHPSLEDTYREKLTINDCS